MFNNTYKVLFPIIDMPLSDKLKEREFSFQHVIVNEGYSDFGVSDVDFSTNITRNIKINGGPLIPSPMDTVAGSDLCIAVADLGLLPTVHYNYPDSPNKRWFESQAAEVVKIKRARSGFITSPMTLSPRTSMEEADKMIKDYKIGSIAITSNGTPNGEFLGILTRQDYSLHKLPGEERAIDEGVNVGEKMIGRQKLAENGWMISFSDLGDGDNKLFVAYDKLLRSHRGIMPIVDHEGKLVSMVSRKDVDHRLQYPNATRDANGRLLVFAAIGTRNEDKEAAEALVHAGVDGFMIETSHAYTSFCFDMLSYLKKTYPDKDVIVGNTTNPASVQGLLEGGVDAIKVGIGPGSICTTSTDGGIGRNPLSAVNSIRKEAERLEKQFYRVPIIGDGGGKSVGDVLKYLVCGADAVMSGRLFAGTEEAIGEFEYTREGKKVKKYRGMGSKEAMEIRGGNRYYLEDQKRKFPEGFVDWVEDRGSVYNWIPFFLSGLRASMQKAGARTIKELYENAELLEYER